MENENKPDYSYCNDTKVSTYTHTWSFSNLLDSYNNVYSPEFTSNDGKIKWNWHVEFQLINIKKPEKIMKFFINFPLEVRSFRFNAYIKDISRGIGVGIEHETVENATYSKQCNVLIIDRHDKYVKIELEIIEEFNFYEENMPKTSSYCTTLYEDTEFTDVVLIANGEEFRAHKAVLANRSSVFRAMLTNDMIESKQNKITVSDVEAKTLTELIRFIYTDSVADGEMDTTMAFELLQAADKYDLEKLKTICEVKICGRISMETAVKTLVFADLYRADLLKRIAIKFIGKNVEVIQSAEWKDLMEKNFDLANNVVVELLGGLQLK